MALNLTIDDCTQARFVLPAAILFALIGLLVIGIEWAQLPFIWEAQVVIGVMLLSAVFLPIAGAAMSRQNRIKAEREIPLAYQSRRRRRTASGRN